MEEGLWGYSLVALLESRLRIYISLAVQSSWIAQSLSFLREEWLSKPHHHAELPVWNIQQHSIQDLQNQDEEKKKIPQRAISSHIFEQEYKL